MKVGQLINILKELDPDIDILYMQNSGITAPIKSVQEVYYRGFYTEHFIGLCCGNKVEQGLVNDMHLSPIYITPQKKQPL